MSSQPPQHPRFGTSGTVVQAKVNAFHLKWSSRSIIYQYATFQPEWPVKPGREVKISAAKGSELVGRMQTGYPNYFPALGASDGKGSLFSSQRYNFVTQAFSVPYDAQPHLRRPKNVRVTVTFAREVNIGQDLVHLLHGLVRGQRNVQTFQADSGAIAAMNMLNIFIQAQPRQGDGNLHKGNSFYVRPTRSDRSDTDMAPLRLWRGFFQSVRPAINQLIVNVDTTVGVVLSRSALPDVCMAYLQVRNFNDLRLRQGDANFAALRQFLRGVKVVVEIQGQRRRPRAIKDLVPNVGAVRFDGPNGSVTVAEHFLRTYGNAARIQEGDLGVRIGQHELFPIQCCQVENQLYRPKMQSPKHVKAMLDFMPRNPEDRLQVIQHGWNSLGYSDSGILKGARITIDPKPLSVEGRILDPPTLRYGGNQKVQISSSKRGVWDAMNKVFKDPKAIGTLMVVNMTETRATPIMGDFIRDLCKVMHERGMRVDRCTEIIDESPLGGAEEIAKILMKHGKRYQPTLTIVILKENAPDVYTAVKRFGDVIAGEATQINGKLGGLNHVASNSMMDYLSENRAMVIGADVSHPGPGSAMPSVAALVSSLEGHACRYAACVEVQHPRAEIIQDLIPMLDTALERFKAANGYLPRTIFFFRDGVSEGEFEQVRHHELERMKARLEHIYRIDKCLPRPTITFIIVGKRHHFRFFPSSSRDADQSGNCPSGFVVDKGITHPVYQDYYLTSQAGLKGTSTPGHYTVLEDENLGGNADRQGYLFSRADPILILCTIDCRLQQLSYALCHCYSRCTRAVKIPAPVYYADLVCGRAKNHYDPSAYDLADSASVHSGGEFQIGAFKSKFSQARTRVQQKGMYFL
ncbi:hypothetical protein VNI00_005844 [Paramarasmius palmivorus]|uniref:Piwi domain-containing protein n=1 Tax=Paramarasmius palmivorus TaxID=297713 RepID=A0AAW0DE16_9AGAR